VLNAETTSRMFSFVINPALTHTQMKAGVRAMAPLPSTGSLYVPLKVGVRRGEG